MDNSNKKALKEAMARAEPYVGAVMKDGTIFAGISPDTLQPMYAEPADAPLRMDFNQAAQYAEKLEIGNQRGFRIPTKSELNVLYKNKGKGALKKAFTFADVSATSWYFSSTRYNVACVYAQRFRDGEKGDGRYMTTISSVHCVRDGAWPTPETILKP